MSHDDSDACGWSESVCHQPMSGAVTEPWVTHPNLSSGTVHELVTAVLIYSTYVKVHVPISEDVSEL